MIESYFTDCDLKPEFKKEFISIFDGWLGQDKLYLLDEVKESDWERFNRLLRLLNDKYEMFSVDLENRTIKLVVKEMIPTYEEDMNRGSSDFTRLLIPELKVALTEDWDYTWILWHKDPKAIKDLSPLIGESKLYHFNDQQKT